MLKLIKFLKPYKKECILGPIFKLIEAILELMLPTIMAMVINKGVAAHNSSYVIKMSIVMIIMATLGFLSSLTCQYFAAHASQGFGTNLRNTLFQHISSFSYAEIDDIGTSSLINRITNDVNQLQLAVAMLIRLVVRAPFICIGAIIMAMIIDFKLSLILLASAPLFGIILYFIISKTSPLYSKYQKKLDKLGMTVGENLTGVRVIRAFYKIDKEKDRFTSANDDLTNTAVHAGKISALLSPLCTLVMNAAIIFVMWFGGVHINKGTLSQGSILAFVNYITQILLALIVVSNLIIIFTKASASAKRVNEILAINSSIVSNEKINIENVDCNEAVEFKDVSFGYSTTGDRALSKISLKVNKGETIGIIGSTGSGKSTLINLIPRFYDAVKGEVLVEGKNVKDYSLKELRNKIGIVPQKAELFTGTILDNIRWGKEDATKEDALEALKISQAYEFVEKFKDGYETMVSRGGINFSGGQKQRLTIARAIVKKPEILILDDSSSALDFATDSALRSAIKNMSSDITVFMVSQRASTIRNADKILVLEDGEICGEGSHEELYENCSVYREICLSQHLGKGEV